MNEIQYWVAKNMMYAPNKTKKIAEDEIKNFFEKYKEIIEDVVKYMPRGMTTVGAAVGRCALLYDKEKAINFIKNSKEGIFQGKEDPVYHFFLWLRGLKGPKRKKHDISTYEITFCACKNYCTDKRIKRLDRYKDSLDWSENWEVKKSKKNESESNEKIVAEFIKNIREKNIPTKDLIAALMVQEKKKSSSNLIKSS